MSLWVLKFGGTSLECPEKIRAAALKIKQLQDSGKKLIVVVSAMGHHTDDLLELAKKVSPGFRPHQQRELDMLLSAGERISMALLSMALGDVNVAALSFTGSQSGIITDHQHGRAHITEIRPFRIHTCLEKNRVAIVAGFQGVSLEKEITTLGRGGSDTTALALAAHFKAERCVIFTDVDGIFSADPRKVPSAKKIVRLSWVEAAKVACAGAGVMHARSLYLAWKYQIPTQILHHALSITETHHTGTFIGDFPMSIENNELISLTQSPALYKSLISETDFEKINLTEKPYFKISKSKNPGAIYALYVDHESVKEWRSTAPNLNWSGPLYIYTGLGRGLTRLPQLFKKVESLIKIHSSDLSVDFTVSDTELCFEVSDPEIKKIASGLQTEIHSNLYKELHERLLEKLTT